MKKILLILSLVAILITSVTALSPTLKQECCFYLGHEDEKFGGYLVEACPEFKLTEKKCKPILAGWESAQDDFARSARPEYACCTYLGRDEEALEIFDEEFVLETCPEFNLNPEKCAAILGGWDYPDDETNGDELGDDTFDQNKKSRDYDKLLIPGLIILAFVGWLIWARKIRKKKK